jgi:hypothetical protein
MAKFPRVDKVLRTDKGCGALRDCRYLLHDRDTKYTQSFRAIIASGQVKPPCCLRAART